MNVIVYNQHNDCIRETNAVSSSSDCIHSSCSQLRALGLPMLLSWLLQRKFNDGFEVQTFIEDTLA